MTVLQRLLPQLPPSLTALSQGILPSRPTLVMASRLLPLHHRGMSPSAGNQFKKQIPHEHTHDFNECSVFVCLSVTMLAASLPVTTKVATPRPQHMGSSRQATRPSRRATASSRQATSSRPRSSKLLLLTLPRLRVPTASPRPTSTASKVDLPVITSLTITVSSALAVLVKSSVQFNVLVNTV